MSAQHNAGVEISIRIGQRVRHQDFKGQRVTGTVQSIAVEDRALMVLIALDRPIIIPASDGCREIQIHTQHVPAHEVAPFDEREELIAELRLACEGLLSIAETGITSLGAIRAGRAAIAKAIGGAAA